MQSTRVYQTSSETIRNHLLIQNEIRLRFIIFLIRISSLFGLELAFKVTNLIDVVRLLERDISTYLSLPTTNQTNTEKRQHASITRVEFEAKMSANEWRKTSDYTSPTVTLFVRRSENCCVFCVAAAKRMSWSPKSRGFYITHNGKRPLDERSARRRGLYLTTHNIHKKQTSMPPAGFEPAMPAGERTQTTTLDSAAIRTGV